MSDIFVVLPPATADGCVIFGKNSDRPPSKVQEVIFIPASQHDPGSKVKCSFVEVDQVESTQAIILSRPAWAWGGEMGANECGVVIGNTSVWTRLCQSGSHDDKLLGVDFVRLGLERGKTAKAAMDVITSLLEVHGQGGHCCEDLSFGMWTYHNSFLIADNSEAWVVDTAGQHWAAHRVSSGIVNISSQLSVSTEIDACSAGLKEKAQNEGLWKADNGEFDFAKVFGAEFSGLSFSDTQKPENRFKLGRQLLENATKEGQFQQSHMFHILRDEESSINFNGELLTTGSQVSVLWPAGSGKPDLHWFTATPNPAFSVFKPFVFCPGVTIGNVTWAPELGEKIRASFQTAVDRRHALYRAHEKGRELMESGDPAGAKLLSTMRELEAGCIKDVEEFFAKYDQSRLPELQDLFKDLAESEVKFYR